jgi:hypothetical protein
MTMRKIRRIQARRTTAANQFRWLVDWWAR